MNEELNNTKRNESKLKKINSSYHIKRRRNQNDINKTEEKDKIVEKISKKEKSQDIVKSNNKDLEDENIFQKPNLLTIIPNKKRTNKSK